MGAQCSDCVARANFDPKTQSRFASRTSNGRRHLLENNVGGHPSEGYAIGDEVIGEGGFGDVRRAVSKKTRVSCALKTIAKSKVDGECLRRELDIVLQLDHPHIVRLFDVYEDWQNVYMVFEMCRGGEVFDKLSEQRRFTQSDGLLLLAQLLYAINYVHAQQVAHRDVTLDNLLFKDKVDELSEANLKLIDFGVARRFVPGKPTMTTLVGSPAYVAPEVLAEDARYNEKCDIWSVGVVGYIFLSGSAPFEGESADEIFERVRRSHVDFSGASWRTVSEDVKALLQSMINRNVASRADAKGALEALKRTMKHDAIDAETIGGEDWKMTARSNGSLSSPHAPQPLRKHFAMRLAAFGSKDRFVKSGWHLIARHVEAEHLQDLQDAFKQLDADGNGMLTLSEVKDGFHFAGYTVDDVEEAFFDIGSSNSERIDYTEFVAALMDRAQYREEELCWEAFRVFDKDHDGHIGINDLCTTLQSTDEALPGMTEKEAKDLILRHDEDGDQLISFQEFVHMMETPRR